MSFIETRGNDGVKAKEVIFGDAILAPSASFGGLYVPKEIPHIDLETLDSWKGLSYKDLAKKVLESFKVEIEPEILERAVARYDLFDDGSTPVPIEKIDENLFCSELWHGPTRAFKDMALQPFGVVLSEIAKKRGEEYLILAATSGDTGPAALSTFEGKEGVKLACMYPSGGTSDVQRLQMVTMPDTNLKVIGIKGNFDDAQSALKNLLKDEEFESFLKSHNIKLSAANSVNFGRIAFQIVYHFHSYLDLLKKGEINSGEKIDVVVPSGNFGNALGGYYAKKAGVPIDRIVIASNDNNILTELFTTGVYDIRNKDLILTTSPAMDILKSSNVERMLFDKFGAKRCKELLEDLEEKKIYSLTKEELAQLQEDFEATFATEEEVAEYIKEYASKDYILDPHTATCIKWAKGRSKKTVIYSTAEWTKFSVNVINAVKGKVASKDEEALELISKEFNIKTPQSIKDLFNAEINHPEVIEKTDITKTIEEFIAN